MKLQSIMKYLKKQNNTLVYDHFKPLKVYIPKFYESRGFFSIENTVTTFGVFKLEIDNYTGTLIFPSLIEMDPTDINSNEDYNILIFEKGSIFIANTFIISNPNFIYEIFTTFVTLGKSLPFLKYDDIPYIFDFAQKIAQVSLNSRRTAFELIYGELTRDSKDLNTRYRNTNMKNPYQIISLHNVVYGPKSTSAKLLGSYFNDGLTGSLIAEHDESYPLEQILKS